MTYRIAKLSGGLALLAGILLALSAPARMQTITADPQNVVVAKDAKQGATTITWDAGPGITSVGATLWQQIDGRKETLVAPQPNGSQKIFIGAGETRVFKLRTLIKSKVLASVTVKATEPTVSFAGMWVSGLKIDGLDLTMTFKFEQTGSKLTGYALFESNGKQEIHFENNETQKVLFDGDVSGNTLRFRRSTPSARTQESTSGEFVMAQDGRSFTGILGTERVIATALANFAGVWRAKWGGAMLELILQQTGTQVTGQARANSADVGIIMDGVIVGNTLSFKVMRPRTLKDPANSPYVYRGTGELVMDEGGKLFTGHVLGTATSDVTLVAR